MRKSEFQPFPESALEHSIFDRFQEIVEKFPNKCAIKSEGGNVTFGDLFKDASAITTKILASITANTPIALLLPQGPKFIAGMFGCLGAGNPYVPLDKNYPLDRLKLMIEVSKPAMLITTRELEEFARSFCLNKVPIVIYDDLKPPESIPRWRGIPSSHAYLLFTSGSTGKPKAVLDCQRNILHNVLRQTNSFFITSDDRQTLLYTCGVYGGARDIFCALLNGATLYHYDIEKTGYTRIGSWIQENQITIYCSVATIFRYLSQYLKDKKEVESVRIIKLGGEASRKSDIEIFKNLFSDECLFYTGLASTETGTVCQYPVRKETVIDGELLPLGSPAIGMKVHVWDSDRKPVSQGEIGEIVVESPYLSLGYYNLPEQTDQKFFTRNGSRFYKIGDLGRYDAKGCLWHCGRGDQQVKIRGNRIELGEVESAFLAQPELADVVVTVFKNGDGENMLAAYVVAKQDFKADIFELRKRLSAKIPTFMVPSNIILMEKFPRTVNGKVDRAALPSPSEMRSLTNEGPVKMDVWHSMIASAWKRVLKCDVIGINDGFFEMGGHSLGLVQLIDEVERRTGVKISVPDFIKNPTIQNMTKLARRAKSDNIPMLPYRVNKGQECLLLIPGVLGLGLTYRLLNEELQGPWSVVSPQLSEENEKTLEDIEVLAQKIVNNTLWFAEKSRIHIFGYSFGGFIGIKVIEILQKRGHEIGMVGLIDSDPPFLSPGTFKLVDPILGPEPVDENADSILAKSKKAMEILKSVRARYIPKFRYEGPVHFIQSSVESAGRQKAQEEQWKIIYPNIKFSQVDASHINLFNFPHVTKVARIIEQALASIEQKPSKTKRSA